MSLLTRTAIITCSRCISILTVDLRIKPHTTMIESAWIDCGCAKFDRTRKYWESIITRATVPRAHENVIRHSYTSECNRAVQSGLAAILKNRR